MEKDYYKILGVGRDATDQEIKKAYRKLAMKYHPDRNPGDKAAEEQFKKVGEAYEVLGNSEKRAQYDQYGADGFKQGYGSVYEDDFGDFLKNSPFSSFFGGGRQSTYTPNYGEDLRIKIQVTLKEIAEGTEKKIKIKRYRSCKDCKGNGSLRGEQMESCLTCKGTGRVRNVSQTILGNIVTETSCGKCGGQGKRIKKECPTCKSSGRQYVEDLITFSLPAGVRQGMELTIKEKGNAPVRGGVCGDLIIQIDEKQDDLLKREGNNICYTLHISFVDAALGCEMEVPTVYGPVQLKIPSGTQSGDILKLRNKGVPDVKRTSSRGDQLVFVQIWTPKSLAQEEKELLMRLKASPNFKPNPEKKQQSFFERINTFFR